MANNSNKSACCCMNEKCSTACMDKAGNEHHHVHKNGMCIHKDGTSHPIHKHSGAECECICEEE